MERDSELVELLKKQASYYEGGNEDTTKGDLEAQGWRFFETQAELVSKVKHLHEFDNDSVTARKAMMIGLNLLSSGFVDEETAENLMHDMMPEQPAGGEQ